MNPSPIIIIVPARAARINSFRRIGFIGKNLDFFNSMGKIFSIGCEFLGAKNVEVAMVNINLTYHKLLAEVN